VMLLTASSGEVPAGVYMPKLIGVSVIEQLSALATPGSKSADVMSNDAVRRAQPAEPAFI